jgi:hypothetical protein
MNGKESIAEFSLLWLSGAMEISDIMPADGRPQRIFCSKCNEHTELAYINFDELVTGVAVTIPDLPILRCPKCFNEQLPDKSRFAIVELHRQAVERSLSRVAAERKKRSDVFDFTDVPFDYDPDDYYYIPGLLRLVDEGFLQPVFFRRTVLLKYDTAPDYRLKFASTTYGEIATNEDSIAFGINRHGNVVMWLGDIAKLPKNEQYYLRSENIASDHALGSEFYDGQIECIFTPRTKEEELFRLRSNFLDKSHTRFGYSIGHLEAEALDLVLSFNPPVIDTAKERRHVADTLNKVYLESLDNSALERIIKSLGVKPLGSGSLKRLQTILQAIAPTKNVASLLLPLYVLYDFRVEYSHLVPSPSLLPSVTARLGLPTDASLQDIYAKLIEGLTATFESVTKLVETGS